VRLVVLAQRDEAFNCGVGIIGLQVDLVNHAVALRRRPESVDGLAFLVERIGGIEIVPEGLLTEFFNAVLRDALLQQIVAPHLQRLQNGTQRRALFEEVERLADLVHGEPTELLEGFGGSAARQER